MYRFFNIFVNKIVNILIIAILILIAFFIGLNTAHAVEVVPWLNSENSPYDSIPTLNSITFKSAYTYSDYNSDHTKQLVFNISNENYFDNSMTIEEFYSNYNYVVYSFGESKIRVLVQDYSLMLENQGLNPISGNQTKFFLYNVGIFYKQSSTFYYHNGVGAFYNWIIDISYNSDSYVVRDEGNRLDIKYFALKYQNGYDTIDRDLNNIRLFDSYNGNLAWVESFNPLIMPTGFEALDISPPNYTYVTAGPYYYFNVFDIPALEFVSSGVPLPEEPDPEEPGGGGESSEIGDKLDGIKGVIDGIYDIVGEVTNEVKDNVSSGIASIKDTIQGIFDFLTGIFTGYDSIEDFFESITFEDNGGISRIVSAPLDLIRSLINNDSCTPLLLPIWGEDIEIPSGCILWENATDEINTLWHTLICGAGGYFILTSLFKDIEKIKNPKSSEVSTLDL